MHMGVNIERVEGLRHLCLSKNPANAVRQALVLGEWCIPTVRQWLGVTSDQDWHKMTSLIQKADQLRQSQLSPANIYWRRHEILVPLTRTVPPQCLLWATSVWLEELSREYEHENPRECIKGMRLLAKQGELSPKERSKWIAYGEAACLSQMDSDLSSDIQSMAMNTRHFAYELSSILDVESIALTWCVHWACKAGQSERWQVDILAEMVDVFAVGGVVAMEEWTSRWQQAGMPHVFDF